MLRLRGLLLCLLNIALLLPGLCSAQQGGIASGVAAAPVYDAQKRPITAGGFVDTGPVIFEDITKQAGLSGWRHKMGVPEKKFIVETNGSGVCLIDYDNDGWLDIYLVNGSTFNALDGKEEPPHAALFHNNHDGTFTDVSAQAGVTNDRWGYGVLGGRLRQRRLARHLCGQLRQEPPLPQQPRRNLYRCGRKGRRGARQLVHRLGLGRLRRRRAAGSLCHRLCALRPRQPAHWRQQGCGLRLLPVSRSGGELRPARPAGRARPSLPQQRRRNLYRRHREGRR